MTQEQKDLLLKDLCARLPYGVKVQFWKYKDNKEIIDTLYNIDADGFCNTDEFDSLLKLEDIKPYLFPLSSMTEEQKTSHNFLKHSAYANPIKLIDWYNKNHFDYRGLIPMGSAIDATGKNIY